MKLGTKLEENMEMPNSHKNELNRDLPFSQQQNRLHLSVIISSYKTEICPSPNSRTDHTSLSLSQATKQRFVLLPTAEQTIPLCHYPELQNRDLSFSQQQNRPYLSVIISSCDLQGGGANGLLLQNFSLWVAGWLEVGGVVQINADVDQGYVEFWIHWVVVQSPHGQLQKNTTHTT